MFSRMVYQIWLSNAGDTTMLCCKVRCLQTNLKPLILGFFSSRIDQQNCKLNFQPAKDIPPLVLGRHRKFIIYKQYNFEAYKSERDRDVN